MAQIDTNHHPTCTNENGVKTNGVRHDTPHQNGTEQPSIRHNDATVPSGDHSNGCSPEPIAIVSMACRWPGEANDPSELWELLLDERSAASRVPQSRFNVDAFYHPDPDRPGSMIMDGGYFLSGDLRDFDPSFFGINPIEAMSLDPLQRKFLEVVYECFEAGGATLSNLSGSNTACFVGNFNPDALAIQSADAEYIPQYGNTGTSPTLIANRVSYIFNLKGPSFVIDTACSSSMYAVHLACQSLLSGDANAAVVGGTNLIQSVETHLAFSKLGALSPTSQCHTFDASADGYGRADGIGALYLKRLSDAVRDNDPIRGVIRGTAINANGKTSGITRPSPDAQEECIRAAYRKAGLDPRETGYFEAHGTGTPTGDPLEVQAIGRVFAESRTADNPLLIGSIKTNLGHSEAASGIAGIMKAVLAVEKRLIPATIGLNTPNPNIDFTGNKVQVVTELTPWPKEFPVRRASINSFGFGGANAHTIVEAVESLVPNYRSDQRRRRGTSQRPFLLTSSAHDQVSLTYNIDSLRQYSQSRPCDLVDLAYTLGCRRSQFFYRAFAVVSSNDKQHSLLDAEWVFHEKIGKNPPNIGFVFTGQGAQWPKMGAELLQVFPTFRRTIKRLDEALNRLKQPPSWKLEEALCAAPEEINIHNAVYAQPLVTAIQVALVNLFAEWKITPTVVVGHSSGEIGAAYAAGYLTEVQAIVVAYTRGLVTRKVKENGAMAAVGLGEREVQKYIKLYSGKVVVACINSPQSVTLSGDIIAVEDVKASLDQYGVFVRMLKTGGKAYHSHHMKAVRGAYIEDLIDALTELGAKKLPVRKSGVKMVSSVAGTVLPSETLDLDYWAQNLESPVMFSQAIEVASSLRAGGNLLVELGPHTALQGPIRQIRSKLQADELSLTYLSTLERGKDGAISILKTVGEMFFMGVAVDMEKVNSVEGIEGHVVQDLPRFQWNYQKMFWHENQAQIERQTQLHPRHDLLGSRILTSSHIEPTWRNILKPRNLPWLSDHKVQGETVFPAAGFFSLAVEAVTQLSELKAGKLGVDVPAVTLRDVSIPVALVVPEDGVEIHFSVYPEPTVEQYRFTVTALVGGEWKENCRGTAGIDRTPPSTPLKPPFEVYKPASNLKWYDKLHSTGLMFGKTFRCLSNLRTNPNVMRATAITYLDSTKSSMPNQSRYGLHPAAIDSGLQAALVASFSGHIEKFTMTKMPVYAKKVTVWNASNQTTEGRVDAWCEPAGLKSDTANTYIADENGPRFLAEGVRMVSFEAAPQTPAEKFERYPYMRQVWKPDIDALNNESAASLFLTEPVTPEIATIMPLAERCTLCIIIQTLQKYPEITPGSLDSQRYFDWVRLQEEKAQMGVFPFGKKVLELSISQREDEISRLLDELRERQNFIIAKLISRIYEHLKDIIESRISGLEVILRDNLLNDVYKPEVPYNPGGYIQLERIVDLIGHKYPSMKILEIGAGTGGATRSILRVLDGDKEFRKYSKYTFTDITTAFFESAEEQFRSFQDVEYRRLDISQNPIAQGFQDEEYDLIVAANVLHATPKLQETLQNTRRLLKKGGRLLLLEGTTDRLLPNLFGGLLNGWWLGYDEGRKYSAFLCHESWQDALVDSGFTGIDVKLDDHPPPSEFVSVMLSTNPSQPDIANSCAEASNTMTIVNANEPTPFAVGLQHFGQSKGWKMTQASLASPETFENAKNVIVLAEAHGPLFKDMDNSEEWNNIKALLRNVEFALWVTNGGLLRGKHPEAALIAGFGRGIMMEEPRLYLCCLDLDHDLDADVERPINIILEKLQYCVDVRSGNRNSIKDQDYRVKSDVVHIPGVVTDCKLSSRYPFSTDPSQMKLSTVPYSSLDSPEVRFERAGLLESMYFEDVTPVPCPPNSVLIKVEAAGLNEFDYHTIMGMTDRSYARTSVAGTIVHTGIDVTDLHTGDRVVAITPGNYGLHVSALKSCCEKLSPDDNALEVASSVIPFLGAKWSLNIGVLRTEDSILIFSGDFALGHAATQIAQAQCAKVFVVAKDKNEANTYNLASDKVLLSTENWQEQLLSRTDGKGVDVLLLTWSTEKSILDIRNIVAPFGRVVSINSGQTSLEQPASLPALELNYTYSRVDLPKLLEAKPQYIGKLLQEVLEFQRQQRLRLRMASFDVTELGKAVRHFDTTQDMIAITFNETNTTPVKSYRPQAPVSLRGDATYLLVGCLGGLGRSFIDVMVERGARNFVFMQRSGADNPDAAEYVQYLRVSRGISVVVVRGDVTKRKDVDRAVAAATSEKPIKGVIQAAMALDDTLYSTMSLEQFHTTIRCKVHGTINVHEATLAHDLDFFLMTSSISSMFGIATQSNYGCANSFQDAFARHRHSLGLPVTCLNLGLVLDIGFVSQFPETEKRLQRNGLAGIPEHEYLAMMEEALRPQEAERDWDLDPATRTQLVVGLEPYKLRQLMLGGIVSGQPWTRNPMFDLLNATTARMIETHSVEKAVAAIDSNGGSDRDTLTSNVDTELEKTIREISERLSRMLFIPVVQMDVSASMTLYGMDSMIAAELRKWLYERFGVQISFFELLSSSSTILSIGERVLGGEEAQVTNSDSKVAVILHERRAQREAETARLNRIVF
ncbi:hypothetical protein EDC01DRAFT_715178 [Geopyxis carbonaria]|nr:hypothetical protein EDC01DRAFT_715178 [Geopyxis carbonaria]